MPGMLNRGCVGCAFPPPGWAGPAGPPLPPVGSVLRGADGEAYRRLWWLLLILLAIALVVFGLPVPPA